ncbi:ATP-binding protein [Streptomyces apocyni]|uniref:ATP-binding protein n=1 Tax=Streptomyces apocyni TaxID=2654677 RepID=UPI0012E9CD43|nr:ATP-binding protein [Streptomyces apocyni]
MLTAARTVPAPLSAPVPASVAPVGEPRAPSVIGAGCRSVRWAPRPALSAVPCVRARVRGVLERWRIPAAITDALLMAASELVTNAVCHAGDVSDRLSVTVMRGRGWVLVEVADGDPELPSVGLEVGLEVALDAEGGRGLMIVQLLAAELRGVVAVLPRGRGKGVRVRVPLP